jgi:hypothetical protein
MKHLLVVIVSIFNHHHEAKPALAAKPALDVRLLDRTVAQLDLADTDKVICVYPVSGK